MTNEEKEQSGQIPPKIKLSPQNGKSKPQGESEAQDTPPEAKTVSGPKSDTSRVDIPESRQTEDKSEESKRDETMRVVLPKADEVETGTLRKKTSTNKPKRTIKIKRPQTFKAESDDEKSGEDVAEAKPVERPKEDTSRIDLSKAQQPPSEEQVQTAKENTMRVVLDEATGEEESVQEESSSKPPRTVRIKRDDVPASESETVVSSEEEEKSATSKTETAKLDLPDTGRSQTGDRKTIRIRRPGTEGTGAGGKTLKISRPAGATAGAEATPTLAEEPEMTMEEVGETRPHAIFSIAALLTFLITGTLIYIMCTQMPFGAKWPWPEKIIFEWQGSTDLI